MSARLTGPKGRRAMTIVVACVAIVIGCETRSTRRGGSYGTGSRTPRADAGARSDGSVTDPSGDGATQQDSGAPGLDGGAAWDSGIARHDSGIARHDSGVARHDSGVARHDSGVAVDAGSPDSGVLLGAGSVTLFQTPPGDNRPDFYHAVSAGFAHMASPPPPSPCSVDREIGECTLRVCGGSGGTSSGPKPHVGAVSLIGAMAPLQIFPGADGQYTAATGSTQLWNPGQSMTVVASGGSAPAFRHSIRAPANLVILHPDFDSVFPSPLDVLRGQDLPIQWAGGTGSAGDLSLSVGWAEQSGGTTRSVSVSCYFPASGGSGVVPGSALAAFPAGRGSIGLNALVLESTDVAGWRYFVWAMSAAVTPSGRTASAAVELR